MDRDAQIQWLVDSLAPRLWSLRSVWARARDRGTLDEAARRRCRVAIHELLTFIYEPGHRANLYSRAGIPRTHNGWEMQLLVDGGRLFALYSGCRALVEGPCPDRQALRASVEQLCARLDSARPEALIQAYAAGVEAELRRPPARVDELVETYLERVVIEAYLRLAMASPAAILTLDLFPAHTGPENVREGLKGLVTVRAARASHRRARRFCCCRAESYTRYYGLNVAKQLARSGAEQGAEPRRFGLVVPHANGVRHITLTRCWPIDGAENAARHVALARRLWAELGARDSAATQILISGYSQGGAAVRLLDDAIHGQDVLARAYFRRGAPRGYGGRCRMLARVIDGEWREHPGPTIHTLSVATMGGLDGWALSERHPELAALAEDQRGAAGVVARSNVHGGVHLAICHDYDPARWILPAPLLDLARARARHRRPRRLSIVRVLLAFGGPNLTLHGGTWSAGTKQAFRGNAPAEALLDEIHAGIVSELFIDERDYFDERCARAAFPQLVVGTHGYPGWIVVEYFARALEAARADARADAGAELFHEGSWRYDILPSDQRYAQIVGAAARFDQRQRRRALALLAALESGQGRGARSGDLLSSLRRRFAEPGRRRHVLRDG